MFIYIGIPLVQAEDIPKDKCDLMIQMAKAQGKVIPSCTSNSKNVLSTGETRLNGKVIGGHIQYTDGTLVRNYNRDTKVCYNGVCKE